MNHLEEFKIYQTICGYTKEEAVKHESIFIRLMAKEIDGEASLEEKIAIRINCLALYNNVDNIPDKQFFRTAKEIIFCFSKEKVL